MVKIHEVMIDRIDKDVDHTILNVNKGKDHLIKHYDNVRSNKGTIIRVKILIILLFFKYFHIFFKRWSLFL